MNSDLKNDVYPIPNPLLELLKSNLNGLSTEDKGYTRCNNMVNDGFSKFTEIGPGKVLCGLNKKINKDLSTNNIESYRELESYEI